MSELGVFQLTLPTSHTHTLGSRQSRQAKCPDARMVKLDFRTNSEFFIRKCQQSGIERCLSIFFSFLFPNVVIECGSDGADNPNASLRNRIKLTFHNCLRWKCVEDG